MAAPSHHAGPSLAAGTQPTRAWWGRGVLTDGTREPCERWLASSRCKELHGDCYSLCRVRQNRGCSVDVTHFANKMRLHWTPLVTRVAFLGGAAFFEVGRRFPPVSVSGGCVHLENSSTCSCRAGWLCPWLLLALLSQDATSSKLETESPGK